MWCGIFPWHLLSTMETAFGMLEVVSVQQQMVGNVMLIEKAVLKPCWCVYLNNELPWMKKNRSTLQDKVIRVHEQCGGHQQLLPNMHSCVVSAYWQSSWSVLFLEDLLISSSCFWIMWETLNNNQSLDGLLKCFVCTMLCFFLHIVYTILVRPISIFNI